jgi:hypothetical protein
MIDGRPLHKEEHQVIQALLQASSEEPKPIIEANTLVTQMDDGGMGSIRFLYPDPQPMVKAVSKAQYTDSDGVLVSINLNVDKRGRLFELDFWKVDFSPLRRYPQPTDLLFET